MDSKSTHFIFNGNKIIISPDLYPIVNFLQEIEKEVESFLGFEKKLELIKKQYKEILGLVEVMAKKLKENSIDFQFTLSEPPEIIAEKLKMHPPIRSMMIILFAHLETLFCLNLAYENKTSDEEKIRKFAMKKVNVESFLERFCLNKENEWGRKNLERLKNITADDLRKLRNSLTHFFSVDKNLCVADAMLDEKSRKLEKTTNFQAKFISSKDLYEIIKGAVVLMIKKWNEDCNEGLKTNSDEFKERILSVRNLIYNSGVVIVKNKQINI